MSFRVIGGFSAMIAYAVGMLLMQLITRTVIWQVLPAIMINPGAAAIGLIGWFQDRNRLFLLGIGLGVAASVGPWGIYAVLQGIGR